MCGLTTPQPGVVCLECDVLIADRAGQLVGLHARLARRACADPIACVSGPEVGVYAGRSLAFDVPAGTTEGVEQCGDEFHGVCPFIRHQLLTAEEYNKKRKGWEMLRSSRRLTRTWYLLDGCTVVRTNDRMVPTTLVRLPTRDEHRSSDVRRGGRVDTNLRVASPPTTLVILKNFKRYRPVLQLTIMFNAPQEAPECQRSPASKKKRSPHVFCRNVRGSPGSAVWESSTCLLAHPYNTTTQNKMQALF